MNANEKTAKDAPRLTEHPMYTASDLAYFRRKGYGDDEILAFWDRDRGMGCKPTHHERVPENDEQNLFDAIMAVGRDEVLERAKVHAA